MRHKTIAPPCVYVRTRFARLFVFFVLCLSTAWSLDTSSSAAAVDCTTPTFGPPTLYAASGITRAAATADFDGDGNADIITISTFDPGVVSLFLGDGTGAFPFRGVLGDGKGRSPTDIATGDFDSDGRPDIVIANGSSIQGQASVYLNNGLIFDRHIPLRFSNADSSSGAVAVADVNGDGKSDVLVTDTDFNGVSVALGDGAGNFNNFRGFNSGSSFPVDILARDLSGDGKVDLAVANLNGGLSILLGDGTGSFGAAAPYAAGSKPSFIASGDFNSDGKVDLIITPNGGAEHISILFGEGAGVFSAPSNIAIGGRAPVNVAVADFNGDGKSDLALKPLSANVMILLGDGAGNFSQGVSPGSGPGYILTPDLNHDGKPDLSGFGGFVGNNVSVLLNRCGATTASLSFNMPVYGVSETANVATVTVIRNGSLAGPVTVNYATSDNTAFSPADYKATSGTLSFADGEASKTFTVEIVNDTRDEGAQAFLVTLSNPSGGAVLGGQNVASVSINDDDPTLTFSVNDVTVAESDGRATITVTRTSDLSGVATLDYRTEDTDTFTVSCADSVNNSGFAYARCDFATTIGNLSFAPGESQKTFTIPIIDDGHAERPQETFGIVLSNPERPGPVSTSAATITITDNDAAGAPNPIITRSPSDYPFFVRQQYLDFLSREPEPGEPWTAVMNRCPNVNTGPEINTDCDRIAVSGAFFGSPEFRLKGFYVFRFYRVAFNRLPQYSEIVADMSFVAGATAEEVYARRAQLARAFTARDEFFDAYISMTNAEYVAALLGRYRLAAVTTPDPAAPDGATKLTLTSADLTNGLNAGVLTRAQVLRAIADSDEVGAAEYNSAFVAVQYYGYLRRTPDDDGYQSWLRVINQDPNNVRLMINGFMNSTEYRLRFGQP
ncbi:MAG TPA: FG-GAP-like repeat-containing protein [Pyrinomonadaceae bacterium]|nr:FG-GAP-like repeat-containing protein [Pyrinomonadaceae bacterium]